MKNKVLLVLLILFLDPCLAENVNEISISGNRRVEQSIIRELLGVKLGQDLQPDSLNALFKKLDGSKLFSSTELSFTSGVLKVHVTENPILRDVIVSGNKLLSTSAVLKILGCRENTLFDPQAFENNLFALKNYYRSSIKEGTKIEYQKIPIDENRIDLEVKIRESQPSIIRSIQFVGNEKYSDVSLKRVIRSKEISVFRLFGTSHYYSRDKLELDEEILRTFYRTQGYFDYVLKGAKVVKQDNGVSLQFKISEGVRYRFGKIEIAASQADLDAKKLYKEISMAEGDIFNIDAVSRTSAKILNALNKDGYTFMDVVPEYSQSKDGSVNVTYRVVAAKKLKIRKINILGNVKTRDYVIRRETLLSENDIYYPAKIAESRRRILNLGFFDEVSIEERQLDNQSLELNIRVKERTTGYINLSGGYGSDVGLFGNFSFTESNFLGTADAVGMALRKSTSGFDCSADFQKKRIFNTLITGDVSVFFKKQNMQEGSLYKIASKGINSSLGYHIRDDLYLNLSYSLNSDNVFDVDDEAPDSVKKTAGSKVLSAIGYILFLDKLDNYFFPSRGYAVRFGHKFAGVGGDVKFVRQDLKIGGFQSLFNQNAVVSLILAGRAIYGYDGQAVDINHRFFGNEMRGFAIEGIGPRDVDTNNALGGQLFLLGTTEVRTPLKLPAELDLKAALFYEVGSVTWINGAANDVYDSGALRSSVGAGIIWSGPLGVLRVDVARALVKDKMDKVSTIKFGVVSPF
ncbi:outer membrane assembly complex, YaeT protein [Neorickettsia helminthoeca str. Oregon]|uniref:Outer membrane protein assembly factor BamA n=1 Tax=Neorickettsia helminthoeca str. Oregon TaxID=1286528 RepID=X5H4J9_9RICK|nr:outer membrane protein assembly factor BamA [Neorickettsia helminthoeca]AHX11613.1 outer membrane assembly complex, YaeT protein [Neorickettsia helminthoeca str. Oregon]